MDQPTSNWEGRPVSSFKMILQLTASDTNLDRQHFGAIHYTALFFVSYFATSHFITSEMKWSLDPWPVSSLREQNIVKATASNVEMDPKDGVGVIS